MGKFEDQKLMDKKFLVLSISVYFMSIAKNKLYSFFPKIIRGKEKLIQFQNPGRGNGLSLPTLTDAYAKT